MKTLLNIIWLLFGGLWPMSRWSRWPASHLARRLLRAIALTVTRWRF